MDINKFKMRKVNMMLYVEILFFNMVHMQIKDMVFS